MKILNKHSINISEDNEVGGPVACVMACGGACLVLANPVVGAFGSASYYL